MYIHASRSWLEVEIDLDWRRLRGIVICRVRGHGSTDQLGDCGHLELALRERATGA